MNCRLKSSRSLVGLGGLNVARLTLNAGILAFISFNAAAQSAVPDTVKPQFDAGSLLRIKERSDSVSMPRRKAGDLSVSDHVARPATSLTGLRLSMKGYKIEGDPRISVDHLAEILRPWNDRELSFSEFEQAAHAVAQFLRSNGHPNAEVKISKSKVTGDVVAIAVQGLTPASEIKTAYHAPDAVEARIHVTNYRFSGVTLASDEELRQVVSPWVSKSLTIKELQQPAEAIANLLRSKGYPLAHAFLPPQRVDSGIVVIAVQEGVVDSGSGHNGIVVTGAGNRIRPGTIEDILAEGVKPGKPLKTEDLEHSLLLANDLPAIKVKADLRPGSQPGTTQVEALVEEGRMITGALWADNYNSRYVGSERVNGLINLNSPFGFGDQLSFNYGWSDGMDSAKGSWQFPIGSKGIRAGVSGSYMNLDISKEVTQYNLNGESWVFSGFGSYPLLRSATKNAYLGLNFDHKELKNTFAGVNANDRLINIGAVTLSGDLVDYWDGRIDWGATVSAGDLDLSKNPDHQRQDAVTAKTEGMFAKFNGSLGRITSFSAWPEWSLATRVSGQVASKNLDVAEKFQLGGPAGVRAYPVGEGLGDHGWLASVELRRHIADTPVGRVQGFLFMDGGGITQYDDNWSPVKPNSYVLGGGGVGASLNYKDRASLSATFAHKIGENPNRSASGKDADGHKDSARIWIMGNIIF
jgi:hemolysin activation/secretion protein